MRVCVCLCESSVRMRTICALRVLACVCVRACVLTGMLLWELFSRGQQPYNDISNLGDVAHAILDGKLPVTPRGCPSAVAEMMQRCWQADPAKRPEFEVSLCVCASCVPLCFTHAVHTFTFHLQQLEAMLSAMVKEATRPHAGLDSPHL